LQKKKKTTSLDQLNLMSDKSVFILGHKGMLGQMALYYFSNKGYKTLTTQTRFDKDNYQQLIDEVVESGARYVVNGIGIIKQKSDELDKLIWANSVLPLELMNRLEPNGQILIQPSTDCVFSGSKGDFYQKSDVSDARDPYGWSKRLGEVALSHNPNALLVRVSIIGLETSSQPKGLLGWFLSNKSGAKLNGFTNHLWNGITTYEWCKQIEDIILNRVELFGQVVHLGTKEYYSKYEMLKMFQNTFETDFQIQPLEHQDSIDRRLSPDIISVSLETQLSELKEIQKEWQKR
jgi:dTDP-4-dehydrorhamnose reductase